MSATAPAGLVVKSAAEVLCDLLAESALTPEAQASLVRLLELCAVDRRGAEENEARRWWRARL